MIGLQHEMTYRLRVRGPMTPTRGSPRGERQTGKWRKERSPATGSTRASPCPVGDWYSPGADGFGRPDVRVQLVTDDDAVILLHYTGLVEVTEAFAKAAEAGKPTRFEDQYMRMAMTFDTGAEQYAWLNQRLYLAEGRLAGKDEIEYGVYCVV